MADSNYPDFGYELRLELDPDKQQVTGLYALAQTLQNLLLVEQGTYPNQPDLGVGITNEQMELLDSKTIDDLKDKIEKQIEKFIHSTYSIQTIVTMQNVNSLSTQKVLVCSFAVKDKANDDATTTDINVIFAVDKKMNLFSKIII